MYFQIDVVTFNPGRKHGLNVCPLHQTFCLICVMITLHKLNHITQAMHRQDTLGYIKRDKL